MNRIKINCKVAGSKEIGKKLMSYHQEFAVATQKGGKDHQIEIR